MLAQSHQRSATALAGSYVPAGTTTMPSAKFTSPLTFRQLTRRPASSAQPVAAATAQAPALERAIEPEPLCPAPVAEPMPAPSLATTPDEAEEAMPNERIALDLITDAANALSVLMTRCQTLEGALASRNHQERSEVEAAKGKTREWEELAQTLQAQIEQLEAENATLKTRMQAAEQERATLRSAADKSQQAAAEAECLSSLFKEKVISSFGKGSPGHSILEKVRDRAA